jgi:hypothetical protein
MREAHWEMADARPDGLILASTPGWFALDNGTVVQGQPAGELLQHGAEVSG